MINTAEHDRQLQHKLASAKLVIIVNISQWFKPALSTNQGNCHGNQGLAILSCGWSAKSFLFQNLTMVDIEVVVRL